MRHIDEAEMYLNEDVTGRAIAEWVASSGSKREDLFITSKVKRASRLFFRLLLISKIV